MKPAAEPHIENHAADHGKTKKFYIQVGDIHTIYRE